jgi:hypothetical protein
MRGGERATRVERPYGSLAESAVRLARLEAELAAHELRAKGARAARATAIGAGAAIAVCVATGLAAAGGAVALALVLPLWAALLVVTGAVSTAAGMLLLIGLGTALRAAPIPAAALAEARVTADELAGRL